LGTINDLTSLRSLSHSHHAADKSASRATGNGTSLLDALSLILQPQQPYNYCF
jgi:hypothetical protein